MAKKNSFMFVAVISGIVLMLISLLAYYFFNTGFIGEIHSEVFGAGIAIFVIGIIYKLFRVKVG